MDIADMMGGSPSANPPPPEAASDMGEDTGDSLLRKALSACGVRPGEMQKLEDALEAWRGGDEAPLQECAKGYSKPEEKPMKEPSDKMPPLGERIDKKARSSLADKAKSKGFPNFGD